MIWSMFVPRQCCESSSVRFRMQRAPELGSPWSSSAGTKDVSFFELSLTFKSAFLHESCFGLDSKTLHRMQHFTVLCYRVVPGDQWGGRGDESCLWGCACLSPQVCLPFSSALSSVPLPSLLLLGILRHGHCPLGLSCVGEEAQVALGCLQFAP